MSSHLLVTVLSNMN